MEALGQLIVGAYEGKLKPCLDEQPDKFEPVDVAARFGVKTTKVEVAGLGEDELVGFGRSNRRESSFGDLGIIGIKGAVVRTSSNPQLSLAGPPAYRGAKSAPPLIARVISLEQMHAIVTTFLNEEAGMDVRQTQTICSLFATLFAGCHDVIPEDNQITFIVDTRELKYWSTLFTNMEKSSGVNLMFSQFQISSTVINGQTHYRCILNNRVNRLKHLDEILNARDARDAAEFEINRAQLAQDNRARRTAGEKVVRLPEYQQKGDTEQPLMRKRTSTIRGGSSGSLPEYKPMRERTSISFAPEDS